MTFYQHKKKQQFSIYKFNNHLAKIFFFKVLYLMQKEICVTNILQFSCRRNKTHKKYHHKKFAAFIQENIIVGNHPQSFQPQIGTDISP